MAGQPLNRFNTGHYADLAQQHADVVEALNNELQITVGRLAEVTEQRDDLLEQVRSLKEQCAVHVETITRLRKPEAAAKPSNGGRK